MISYLYPDDKAFVNLEYSASFICLYESLELKFIIFDRFDLLICNLFSRNESFL